jgi:hypothetical protein
MINSYIVGAPTRVYRGTGGVVSLPCWSVSSPHLAVYSVFFIHRFLNYALLNKYKLEKF